MVTLKSTDGYRWAFFKRYDIPDVSEPGVTYLRRWRVVQTPLFSIYVHKIMRPDNIGMEHTHPWNFHSIILKGGYVEEREGTLVPWGRGSVNSMKAEEMHQILSLMRNPTWTLMFTGRRKEDWFFREPDGTLVSHKVVFERMGL